MVAGFCDAPLEFEYFAKPTRMRPSTAVAMPEVSEDFKTFTFRIKPGIYFADDPAFKGKRRELVAEDYVYTIKRYFDPATKPSSRIGEEGISVSPAVSSAVQRSA